MQSHDHRMKSAKKQLWILEKSNRSFSGVNQVLRAIESFDVKTKEEINSIFTWRDTWRVEKKTTVFENHLKYLTLISYQKFWISQKLQNSHFDAVLTTDAVWWDHCDFWGDFQKLQTVKNHVIFTRCNFDKKMGRFLIQKIINDDGFLKWFPVLKVSRKTFTI